MNPDLKRRGKLGVWEVLGFYKEADLCDWLYRNSV
jgi:hypothetical protein